MLAMLVAASLAAPVPKAKPALYFPTVEGTKWITQVKSGNDLDTTTTKTVTKVVEKDGKYTVTISRRVSLAVEFKYEVSEKGVFILSDPNGELAEPTPLLKLPAKQGDTWTHEITNPKQRITTTATFTVGKEEEVEVPAGKFKAIPVVMESVRIRQGEKGEPGKGTTWFAVGVGVVKQIAERDGTERVYELKEFTPKK